jgi:hypothetical protein
MTFLHILSHTGARQFVSTKHMAENSYLYATFLFSLHTLARSMMGRDSRLWAPNLSSVRYGKGGYEGGAQMGLTGASNALA